MSFCRIYLLVFFYIAKMVYVSRHTRISIYGNIKKTNVLKYFQGQYIILLSTLMYFCCHLVVQQINLKSINFYWIIWYQLLTKLYVCDVSNIVWLHFFKRILYSLKTTLSLLHFIVIKVFFFSFFLTVLEIQENIIIARKLFRYRCSSNRCKLSVMF